MRGERLQDAFRTLAAQSDADPLTGALLIAALFDPECDLGSERARIDELAARAIGTDAEGLARWLFVEEGFRGNTGDYHDPRNSLIPAVLDRKLGIPITLALVFVEVARRCGIAAHLLPIPGHVVIESGDLYLNPFGGQRLSRADLARFASDAAGQPVPIDPYLRPMTAPEIWLRMIANLKAIYAHRSAWDWVYRLAGWRLVLEPDSLIDLRERGTIAFRIGEYSRANADLGRYIDLAPDADDAADLRRALVALAS